MNDRRRGGRLLHLPRLRLDEGIGGAMASFGERVVGAMSLNPKTFEEVEHDQTAMGQAVGVIVLAAVSTALGNIFWGGLTGIVWNAFASLIGYAVWAVIVWLVGTKVMPDPNTKADFPETFRTIGFAAAPGVLGIITIIPLLGWLLLFVIWLWTIAAMVVAVREVLDYSDTVKAVIVVVIGFVVQLIVSGLISAAFLGTAMLSRMYS
jgi:hypothetical protein